MPLIDTTSSNETIRRLLMMKIQEMMADKSLQRQFDYLDRSNELYGQRQKEYIKASGEKEKDVATFKAGLDKEKIAAELEAKLSQEPLIKQLALRWRMAKTPEERAQYEKALGDVGELFGSAMEDSEMGRPITSGKWKAMTMWVEPQTLTSLLSSSTTSRGAYMSKESADKRLALEGHKQDWAERSPETGEKMLGGYKVPRAKETGYNKAVASKAKAVLSYVQKQKGGIDEFGNATGGDLDENVTGMLMGLASEIESRALQGEFIDKDSAKRALDLLDLIYKNPQKAVEKINAMDWMKKEEGKRSGAGIPADAPTATNPETGERVAYVNGKWIKIK